MIFTFLMGVLALLAWLYATSGDRLARRLLWIGLLYALAASLLIALAWFAGLAMFWSESDWWLLVLVAPLIEESVKSHAARSQKVPIHSFALVCLFGIYELMLSKPAGMARTADWQEFSAALETLPALTFHLFTAAIYAFHLKSRPRLRLAICVIIHGAFNGLWVAERYAIMPIVCAVFVLGTLWLFPWKDCERRGRWDPI